ncbi:Glycoside hydrolase, family 32 like protein [Aduncisulcus paluster]|uniref:Glycoside hydrolase, family 32 like protein n=1 Tax=Aduncisulcus paluster TaxID=2918883 RepID=A0ABQ5K5A7_9EUKA|nr:Glycoside hydrolase, family 32 like protein [Aduncisulcus paluster]
MDSHGDWSGGTFYDSDRKPWLPFTCVGDDDIQRQCLAEAVDDSYISWDKLLAENPVLVPPDDSLDSLYRDPGTVYLLSYTDLPDDDSPTEHMILGSGDGINGTIRLVDTSDMYQWKDIGVLLDGTMFSGYDEELGFNWECPDLFAFDYTVDTPLFYALFGIDKIYTMYYATGSIELTGDDANPYTFNQQFLSRLDYGSPYASRTYQHTDTDAEGIVTNSRRLMWTWIKEERDNEDIDMADPCFAGVMGFPREVFPCDINTADDLGLTNGTVVGLLTNSRRLMWTWIKEERDNEDIDMADPCFAGVMGFPREVFPCDINTADDLGLTNGTVVGLCSYPIDEMNMLRLGDPATAEISPATVDELATVEFDADQTNNGACDIVVTTSTPIDQCTTSVILGFLSGNRVVVKIIPSDESYSGVSKLIVDKRYSSSSNLIQKQNVYADIPPSPFSTDELRIVWDHSVVELYLAGGVVTVSTRFYPDTNMLSYVEVSSDCECSVNVWKMDNIILE